MASGSRSTFGAPMFGPEVFRKQMYCTEESTSDVTLLGLFGVSPQSFDARMVILRPGIVPPSLRPCLAETSLSPRL